ncbi:hypothetical protein MVES1_001265 [Malassezia vespertilionis]|uniref:uncharacterized protein n=1 Tax=Malassezia vespertilionis TaxID=2020962 RepID=UPI0024B1D569|nr:uncharacterized protein MVES1_001265 [Malassezia vespertilionis]WFD05931.1 hypothetical protein MVES1_001265 [Malassezia vespertilionis]
MHTQSEQDALPLDYYPSQVPIASSEHIAAKAHGEEASSDYNGLCFPPSFHESHVVSAEPADTEMQRATSTRDVAQQSCMPKKQGSWRSTVSTATSKSHSWDAATSHPYFRPKDRIPRYSGSGNALPKHSLDDWSGSDDALPSLPGSPGWARAQLLADPNATLPQPGCARPGPTPPRLLSSDTEIALSADTLHLLSRLSNVPFGHMTNYVETHVQAPSLPLVQALHDQSSVRPSHSGSSKSLSILNDEACMRNMQRREESMDASVARTMQFRSFDWTESACSSITHGESSQGRIAVDLQSPSAFACVSRVFPPSDKGTEDASALSDAPSAQKSRAMSPLHTSDLVGPGLFCDGALIQATMSPDREGLPSELRVVEYLGRGSYAVVYKVQEVLEASAPHSPRPFALKCLPKENLTPEMVELQRIEYTIHQSIPVHPNIVTLHGTFETPDWLFLLLEYCPGHDLYFWLEEADNFAPQASDAGSQSASLAGSELNELSETHESLAAPWLLSQSSPHSLLSPRRLELVAEMFAQMCRAVQVCHDHGISHRDLKPENFVVEDLRTASANNGVLDNTVVVKLTDFGLATLKDRCDDFNCGSKPYMAYECRNNVEDSYNPRYADVWSLGIVLLNLIFHRNPFSEPCAEHCASFSAFCCSPIQFLVRAFDGLTVETAKYLCDNVFCDVTRGQAKRITPTEFAEWARTLPQILALDEKTEHVQLENSLDSISPLLLSRIASSQAYSRYGSRVSSRTPSLQRQALSNSWHMTFSNRITSLRKEISPTPSGAACSN